MTNNLFCQIFVTISFFFKTKEKNTKIKTRKTKSRTTINTTEETIKRTTATF